MPTQEGAESSLRTLLAYPPLIVPFITFSHKLLKKKKKEKE